MKYHREKAIYIIGGVMQTRRCRKAIKSLQRAKGVNGQEVYAKCRSDCRITGNGCQVPLHNFGKLRFLYNDDPGAYRTGEQSLPDRLSFTVGVNHSQGAENKQQNYQED